MYLLDLLLFKEMDPLLKLVLDPPPISTTIHHPQFEVNALRKIIRAKWKARSKVEDIDDDINTLAVQEP